MRGMSIRRTILTSGGLASAIGVCLAILSAGTLVVFSVVAARVGLEDLSNEASVATPRTATKGPPAAITFPPTQEPSEENEGIAATSNAPLLDIIESALDAGTSSDALVGSATSNASGLSNDVGSATSNASGLSNDVGSEPVGAFVSEIDAGGRNVLSTRRQRSAPRPKLPGREARPGDDEEEPKDKKGDDRVAARRDDEDESDHGDDDDDDDGNRAEARHGSRDGDGTAHVHSKAAQAKGQAKRQSKALVDEPRTKKGHGRASSRRDRGHDSHRGHDNDDSDWSN
jgi:hypothetical protein